MAQQPLVDQGLPIIEPSWSHSDTPQSVLIHWTSDQPDSETSIWHHKTRSKDNHSPVWIRTRNPSKLAVVVPRHGPHGDRDRHDVLLVSKILFLFE
jgi:hypothetical protein